MKARLAVVVGVLWHREARSWTREVGGRMVGERLWLGVFGGCEAQARCMELRNLGFEFGGGSLSGGHH